MTDMSAARQPQEHGGENASIFDKRKWLDRIGGSTPQDVRIIEDIASRIILPDRPAALEEPDDLRAAAPKGTKTMGGIPRSL